MEEEGVGYRISSVFSEHLYLSRSGSTGRYTRFAEAR